MTELYKRSLTADRREALAKHRPVYFARRNGFRCVTILPMNYFIKKAQNIQNFFSIQTSFPLP